MRKMAIVYILAILAIFVGISTAGIIHTDKLQKLNLEEKRFIGGTINKFEQIYKIFMQESLPESLDKQYTGSVPEKMTSPYLFRMFGLAELFEGIGVNLQNGDMQNATASYNAFSRQYNQLAKDVPEWSKYFDTEAVEKLGKDLKSGTPADVTKDMGQIGATCSKCHEDVQPQVWAKYYWKDFDNVKVKSPVGVDIPWKDGMFALASGFDSIGVYAQQGNKTGAIESFNIFKTMLLNFRDVCSNCHENPRYYFVSQNELNKVDEIGTNITSGNLAQVKILQEQFGENCYKCHVIHMPPQDMKAKIK